MKIRNDRHEAALKSWRTRRHKSAFVKAQAAAAASKAALEAYCTENGWKVAFFEGATGAPRTGIVDAVAFRIARGKPDALQFRLIQLKGGSAGVSGREIARLKKAATEANVNWWIAAFDGEALQLIPAAD
jgi:hypothetical protein